MQLFGGKYDFPDSPRMSNHKQIFLDFDDFFSAYITVFQVMTMENWNDILTASLRTDVNYALTLLYKIK